MKNPLLTSNQQEQLTETIKRLTIRAKECWYNPNPYYDEPKAKNEYIEIKIKLKELEKLKKNN